jgi:hypothetical protein
LAFAPASGHSTRKAAPDRRDCAPRHPQEPFTCQLVKGPVLYIRGIDMWWLILGLLVAAGAGIVLMVALSQLGDEPGAYRFGDLPSDDERPR